MLTVWVRLPLSSPKRDFMNKYYIVYITANKIGWVIMETELDLKTAAGINGLIEKAKKELETDIVPVFWRKLDS